MRSNLYPSLAQIAGHALNSIFLDSLAVDIERLQRINRTLQCVAAGQGEGAGPEPAPDQGAVHPPESADRAHRRALRPELPRAVASCCGATGAMNRSGSNLASYLLFEEPFCRRSSTSATRTPWRAGGEMLAFLRRGA